MRKAVESTAPTPAETFLSTQSPLRTRQRWDSDMGNLENQTQQQQYPAHEKSTLLQKCSWREIPPATERNTCANQMVPSCLQCSGDARRGGGGTRGRHLEGQPHGVAVLPQRVQLQCLPQVAAAGRLVLCFTADTHLDTVKLNLDRGTQTRAHN